MSRLCNSTNPLSSLHMILRLASVECPDSKFGPGLLQKQRGRKLTTRQAEYFFGISLHFLSIKRSSAVRRERTRNEQISAICLKGFSGIFKSGKRSSGDRLDRD